MATYNVGLRLTTSRNPGDSVAKAGAAARNSGQQANRAAGGWSYLGRSFRAVQSAAKGTVRMVGAVGQRSRALYEGMVRGAKGVGQFASSILSLRNIVGGYLAFVGGRSIWNGLIGSNADLEQAQLGIAALTRASLEMRDRQGRLLNDQQAWAMSMKVGNDQIQRFRAIALKDPIANTKELLAVYQAIVGTGLQAGSNVTELTNLSQSLVSVAKILKEPGIDTTFAVQNVARDVNQLLSGSAAINELSAPMRIVMQRILGVVGGFEKWNKLNQAQKIALITKETKRFARPEMIDAYAKSWNGLVDTFGEWIERVQQIVGAPAFSTIKSWMQSSIDWLNGNQKAVEASATAWGKDLAKGLQDAYKFGVNVFKLFQANKNTIGATVTGAVKDFKGAFANTSAILADIREAFITAKQIARQQLTPDEEAFLAKRVDERAAARFQANEARKRAELLRIQQRNRERAAIARSAAAGYKATISQNAQKLTTPNLPKFPALTLPKSYNFAPNLPKVAAPAKPQLATPIVLNMPSLQIPSVGGGSSSFGGNTINLEINQQITAPDPVTAGNRAAQAIPKATQIAADRLGPPITEQSR